MRAVTLLSLLPALALAAPAPHRPWNETQSTSTEIPHHSHNASLSPSSVAASHTHSIWSEPAHHSRSAPVSSSSAHPTNSYGVSFSFSAPSHSTEAQSSYTPTTTVWHPHHSSSAAVSETSAAPNTTYINPGGPIQSVLSASASPSVSGGYGSYWASNGTEAWGPEGSKNLTEPFGGNATSHHDHQGRPNHGGH